MLPELEGAAPDNREPILSELTEDSHNPPRRAFILGDYKLLVIKERKFLLFNLRKDPGELTDLAAALNYLERHGSLSVTLSQVAIT